MSAALRVWFVIALALSAGLAQAADKVALLSTSFVLERKFKLMEEAARLQGVELAWTQVDRAEPAGGEAGARRVLQGARLVILDTPRSDDQAQIERVAGKLLREAGLPTVGVQVMSPPQRLRALQMDAAQAQRLFDYYVGGTRANHERLAAYLKAWLSGGDLAAVSPPVELPNGGIYHPGYEQAVFAGLPQYLAWWQRHSGRAWQGQPVVAMETSSSYLSDGQARMLDESVRALEKAGAVPLVFYRSSRVQRSRSDAAAAAASSAGAVPAATAWAAAATPGAAASAGRPAWPRRGPAADVTADNPGGFPNPQARRTVELDEPLITLNGQVLPQVLIVNTFLGVDPEARKAWHQALGIPVINLVHYRSGTRADYAKDPAGINSFYLPFTLTSAEYMGLQDPVVLTANEGGELMPMPEQMDLLVGKSLNLARLALAANADKNVALLFWNHPPGEKNQGASNLNVPRSIEHLVDRLRAEGYAFDAVSEAQVIAAVAQMLRPTYRKTGLADLMKTPHWDFLPLASYQQAYVKLPAEVRGRMEKHFGSPEKSHFFAHKAGVPGFVVPRLALGRLVVMPQTQRGEAATMDEEKKLFHDTKVPLNHAYLAQYLWIREQFKAHAIVHFGTHGTQEWTPGKERGLWAYDDPNLLVGNVPVVYPYIVDNIGEAIHVKRRGRGVIVSHQTPAFSPAGLSDDFVLINDAIREYGSLDEGLVKENARSQIIELAVKMNIAKDLKWRVADLEREFPKFLRDIEDYLEDLGAAQQPLGLHTLGRDTERAHLASNVMQMLGQSLYERYGFKSAKAVFKGDYRQIQQTQPYRFVEEFVLGDKPVAQLNDAALAALADKGRRYAAALRAAVEIEGISRGLSAKWIDPSYGGDPIRNPDAVPTGRNMYGFDPGRVPTRAAYAAGQEAVENLIRSYQATHGGQFPDKLAFTMWSTETMRHLGMLEAQILWAMGVKPTWDAGGRVTGMQVVPLAELGRPRIDAVISLTGLYRDQFPNVMERFNEAIAMLAKAEEDPKQNFVRANSQRVRQLALQRGLSADEAEDFALTRIFGNESGDYSTKLTDASLASDQWKEGDGKLEKLYLSRMSWAYGPNSANWSRKFSDAQGAEFNAYAEHLKGTRAAVFSRSSNLRGLLDTDHPFEYLGGISMAVKHLDGAAPQLYISNMRDPGKAKLETAEKFMATELRAVYQHPRWMAEMKKQGYAGTLQMLNTINNFWGWQVMDRNVVRDDQWQEFHDSYVKDRYQLGLREWFEKSNPTALAQVAERMLEAIRKDYWKADEQTRRELVATYQDIARRHDVQTNNETFKAYVKELAAGYGIGAAPAPARPAAPLPQAAPPAAAQPPAAAPPPPPPPPKASDLVRGQQLREVPMTRQIQQLIWAYGWLIGLVLLGGIAWQAWRTRRENRQLAAPIPQPGIAA
ncbi:MAG: cobaltochelatase subunit CobN [Rubrivivax sp.]|nr:cobaltochelatase subunit CobN [Rubrivivax sp.]